MTYLASHKSWRLVFVLIVSLNKWLINEQVNMITYITKITCQWFLFSYKCLKGEGVCLGLGRVLLFLFFLKTCLPAIFGLSMITFKHKIKAIWKLTNMWQLFPINVLVVRLHVERRAMFITIFRCYFTSE